MARLLLAFFVLMPSAAMAQYNYGGMIRVEPQPCNPYPGRHVQPGYPMHTPNGPTTVYTKNEPKNCHAAAGIPM
jgi:hypothetical protein